MSDVTIFEKILSGEIPCDKVYEDENVLGFNDISPQAPIHILFIHKKKTKNINELAQEKPDQLASLFMAIAKHTQSLGLDKSGFRIVTNTNQDAGQTVFYTHFHVLAGAKLKGFGS